LDLIGFERREVVLVDGFGEMTGQNDAPTSWDWVSCDETGLPRQADEQFSIPKIINTTLAPFGTAILEVSPLVTASTDNMALALLSTPKGVVLTRLALTAESTEGESTWSAIRGDQVSLGDMEIEGMVLSQSAVRGGLGLVGVVGAQGMTLVLCPPAESKSKCPNSEWLPDGSRSW
jgi:hypothetical protein